MLKMNNNKDVDNVLHLIGIGLVGAEIGVELGSTSIKFLRTNPQKLYLVDPWSMDGYEPAMEANDETFDLKEWLKRHPHQTGAPTIEAFNAYYDKQASDVRERFKDTENVEICRMNSTDWFKQFKSPFLDWIYIDGDHSYTGAYNDYCNALKVVKSGGIIIGDDYVWDSPLDKGGVKKAVNQWAKENSLRLEKHGKRQVVVRL